MAKKKRNIVIYDSTYYDELQLQHAEYYTNIVKGIYDKMAVDMATVAATITARKPGIFSFDDYPALKGRIDTIIRSTNINVTAAINTGIDDAWLLSNLKNDKLVDAVAKVTPLGKRSLSGYMNRNLEALAQTRTPASELSKSVFKITKQFKGVMEFALDEGVGTGAGARKLASSIYQTVSDLDKTPEFAFRRVRNKNGDLQWSKAYRKYQQENDLVGKPGVYNNPRKNYERVTRTETNRSYRKADQARYKQLDFVVGVRINLSNNPNHCPLCIALAGDYPVNYIWSGNHPQCRCYKTSIIKTDAELEEDNVRIIEGKQPLVRSENSVTRMPKNYTDYINEHKETYLAAQKRGKLPWFLKDAYVDGDFTKGVNLKKAS